MEPRNYQQAAFDAVWKDLREHRKVVVDAPTASGKTIIIAMLAAKAKDLDRRTWVITDRKELIAQNAATLAAFRPDLMDASGIVSAGLNRDERDRDIVFGSVQTLHARMPSMDEDHKRVSLLIIDEAHMTRSDDGRFVDVILELERLNPKLRIVGLTASPYRLDNGPIVNPGGGAGAYEKLSYRIEIPPLVEQGYLCPLVCYCPPEAKIDTTGIKITAGEFNLRQLEDAAMAAVQLTATDAAKRLTGDLRDRRSVIVFAAGLDHMKAISGIFRNHGIDTDHVSSEDNRDERDRKIADFKAGRVRALVNVGLLTTGFDYPGIDCLVDMRPTKSPSLYIQIRGRPMRIADSKTDAVILDYSGNTIEHGPIDQVNPPGRKKKGAPGNPVVRSCPQCGLVEPAGVRKCSKCGHVHERRTNLSKLPMGGVALSDGTPQWMKVHEMKVRVHQPRDNSRPPTLRIDFRVGLTSISQYLSLERDHAKAFAYARSTEVWRKLSKTPSSPPPKTVLEAAMRAKTGELMTPRHIYAARRGKFYEISAHDTSPSPFEEVSDRMGEQR